MRLSNGHVLNHVDILCCISCQGNLIMQNGTWVCTVCKIRYPSEKDILLLASPQTGNDVALSESKWQILHKDHQIDTQNDIELLINTSYISFLSRYKNYINNGYFLDLGCGVAWVSAHIAQTGVTTIGIDISREALKKSARMFHKKNLHGSFIQGSLLQLPIKNNTINFIYSCMSLEYVKDTKQALTESYRVLKKGGIMVAIVPVVSFTTLTYHQTRGDIPGIPIVKQLMEFIHIHILRGKYMKYGYEQSFTVGSLRSLFQSAGFTVNKIDFFPMYYPLAFLPRAWQPVARRLLRHRFFWPLVYVETRK